jgi:translation initiation factor 2A
LAPVVAAVPGVKTDDKKIKQIGKKLKAIQDIKDKIALGLEVEITQVQKVSQEAALLEELAQLNLAK